MKTLKFLFAMLIASIGLLIHTSCEYEPLGIPVTPPPPDSVKVSYSTDIQPIWDAKCISCHKPGFFKVDLTSPNSYANIFAANLVVKSDADNSKLYTKILGGHNSPSASQLEYIKKWINEGAEDN